MEHLEKAESEVIKDLQEFIYEAWNEAEELNTSLRELNDRDLVDCKQSLINRTNKIMETLDELGYQIPKTYLKD